MFYAMSHDTAASHLDPEDLERYVRTQVSEEETARFEEHLLLCEPCREELRSVDSFVASMRAAAADWRRPPQRDRSWWSVPRLVPALAVLALLLIAAVVSPRFTGSLQPAIAINLSATRSAGMETSAPAGRKLALTPDVTGLPADATYRLEIVDEQGTPTWQGRYTASQGTAHVSAQRAGAHFVRIYSSAGELLREYDLVVSR